MKTALLLSVIALASVSAEANRAAFLDIAQEASVANGSADVTTFDLSLTKAALQAQGKAELEKDYWENCGPWKIITSRREAIKQITWIEGLADETKVAEKITALYEKNEIFAVVGAISNNEIECSLSWINIYGTDGSKLELRYNIGD